MNHSPVFRCIAATTLLAFVTTSCGGKAGNTPVKLGSASPITDAVLVQAKDIPDGLDLRLSNGHDGPPAFDHSKLAPATKLADADAKKLLERAPAIKTDPDDQQAFALRPNSQPPPRTGQTLKGQFPPPPSSLLPPIANDAGKDLRVLRYMPEGEVPLAPELSVTFSQPMVAVTSQTDAAAVTPVKLTPTPKGKWRWIGTRTILFDPEVRFPQAQTYHVEIPAGTKSANGGVLKDGVKFTFETPAPKLVWSAPSNSPNGDQPQKTDVPMFAMFDQKIDQAQVLSHIKLTANGTSAQLRLLDAAEIAKDKQFASVVEQAKKDEQDGRWVAFRATAPLPTDARIEVTIAKGTPSAEGPNTTKADQQFGFRTYPPLKLVKTDCGWGSECRPGMPLVFEMNNPLDVDAFNESQVRISPDIPDVKILTQGQNILVEGMTSARTKYTLTVASSLRDDFGQTLGKDETRDFKVGDATPTFFGPSGMVVLDPGSTKPTLDFFTINYSQLKVKLYRVAPSDLDAFGNYMRNLWNHDHKPTMPGTKVFDELVATGKDKNELVQTSIDLAPALAKSGLGHAIAVVEPYPWTETYDPPRMIAWVQSTKLAVDAHVDGEELLAFATNLDTGKAAAGVELEIRPFGTKATTDDKGLATLPLSAAGVKGDHYLVARRGEDVAFVTDDSGYYNETGNWFKQNRGTTLSNYVVDDRALYKPGEEVSLKGWLRLIDFGKNGDVGPLAGEVNGVDYVVMDSQNNQIGKGSVAVSPAGGFDTKFTLPKTPNLGYARVEFTTRGKRVEHFQHGFQVEEFRTPEFEANAKPTQGPFMVGGTGDVTVDAKYFAGGPLAGADVNWNVNASQTTFTPPNRDDYVFGMWQPWWGYHSWDDDEAGMRGYKPPRTWSLISKTDATGSHTLHFDFLSAKPSVPMAVTAYATVTDVNRQQISASASLIVHPSSLYVGLKTKRMFVEKGTPFDLDVIGVDLDGKAAPGAKIEVKAVRMDWEYKHGRYVSKEVDPQTCDVTAADKPAPCTFATAKGGTYQVKATIVDSKGRANQSSLEFWVTGGDTPPAREISQEVVQLIPSAKTFAAGDTAELLVQAPFYPAEGVVTWRRSGIVKVERITLDGPTTTLKVPIVDAMVPNLDVQVDLVGMAARTDDKGAPDAKLPKRPAYAVGVIDLMIPPKQRTLGVKVAPAAAKVSPGEQTKLAIDVTDANGKPVANAETSVIVVDEAVLSLTGYQFGSPIDTFYSGRGADTRDFYERAYVKLADPEATRQGGHAASGPRRRMFRGGPGGGGAKFDGDGIVDQSKENFAPGAPPPPPAPVAEAAAAAPAKVAANKPVATADPNASAGQQPGTPIAIRTNFNPLAAFSPTVMTDAAGKATVAIKMPDNLTRYRIVAIAAAGDRQFGKGESAITARLPLMVRPSPPRFLNFGDTFRLPVVIQNQTDNAMTVKLAVRASNASITDGAGREVQVPANDRIEVQFPAAAQLAGTARFQIVGSAGSYSDAAELALPVWTPATTEAFATYGVIDDGAIKQPVALPGQVVTQFGGIDVTTASTNLQALTDALLYLVHYPFECAEQRSSRIMSIAALKDVLASFKTKDMPSQAAMERSVATDIDHLTQMQNSDGGFAYWDRGYPSEPYLSVYVVNALAHAKAKGFAVPASLFQNAKVYLQNIEQHYPWFYSKEVRWAISSYALYTRKQIGDLDIAKGQKLLREAGGVDKVTIETDGWLLGLFTGNAAAADERKAIVRYAINHVSETAGAANFTTSYGDGNYLILSSDHRVDAVMLESLIQEQKDLDLIPKLVTGLLAHRKAGRWLNTQENTFALLALDLYFQTYEKTTPDFVARMWLGNDYAGDHPFKGRSTDYYNIAIPMKDVATHDKQDLTIQKDGKGRLYYRIGMTYAPASLKLDAADYGFVVERQYEGVDDPKDVTRAADGTWHVKAGSRVRVRLNMVNENRRYHVALVDPLPAGFETMNPALATTGPIPEDPKQQKERGAYWWWYGPWYEHQNMRDERVEAFAAQLWEGVHKYDYVARATTPGNFVVPTPKAEEMYMPETFGRGASDRVIVE